MSDESSTETVILHGQPANSNHQGPDSLSIMPIEKIDERVTTVEATTDTALQTDEQPAPAAHQGLDCLSVVNMEDIEGVSTVESTKDTALQKGKSVYGRAVFVTSMAPRICDCSSGVRPCQEL